jgi:hypothetical protein
MALMAWMVRMERKGLLVPLVPSVLPERKAPLGLLVQQVLRVLLVPKDPLALPELPARKEILVLLAKAPIRPGSAWVTPARKPSSSLRLRVRRGLRGLREPPVHKDLLVLVVLPVPKVPLERMEPMVSAHMKYGSA